MPVPKRKRSRARRDKRFANKAMSHSQFNLCSNCSAPVMSHQACVECGFYGGRKVLTTKAERAVTRTSTRKTIADKRTARQNAMEATAESVEADKK